MKVTMYTHGGSANHGCEAIVRTTADILRPFDSRPILLSYQPVEDRKYGVDSSVEVRSELNPVKKLSIDFLRAYADQRFRGRYHRMDALMHKIAIEELPEIDIALFVGGDNYCYSDAKNYGIINSYMRKKAKKNVLWGASVEPALLSDLEIRKDISRFDRIFSREPLSYEALKKVNKNTILLPDPAFFLPAEAIDLPSNFVRKNVIGINVSPLVMRHEKVNGRILRNYEKLIEFALRCTDSQIALIPHVVWERNDDREPLNLLYKKYHDTERVFLIPDHNCMQLKYVISQCRFFIGARTHATIAAYSTGIPTVVVGYSVKARGIAGSLFSMEDHYVISAQKMEEEDELVHAFQWLQEHESETVKMLWIKMEEYRSCKEQYLKEL